ncbi:nitrite/sulfite reductase domain-containing protein [Tepidibacter aestuarii]|uniref:NAD(P)/FAD-dependent oxidoreductase n=1 Tax=Tepidibacter aestuarii TaxID=2925782 RepID=UPI0020BDDC2B|nr:NAD(P)/FAD-dependent oxidoreductase [Tepidibacter aestuarii]CAH2212609.1 Nitrite/Sulfite reductase ferredoxin-like half domain-containing protein [Tepidibacter aestuarii]
MGAHFGNLQKIKDGKRTFAITPHIPGGFVTADTMIKIADTAKKYNGILKITSGQRIMITNLKEEDLSNIWKDLDMEPAVKNQYSIKNVEMCPAGFCKRSKENTIRIGMKISKNFHGKAMPNRTKIGVAGCRNACTSVYAKDVGVIATKEGFIITAGGSAGFHQRMSDIITENLSEEDAYRLVEIILDYYNENALMGEKLGFFIDRIGIEKFRNDVVEKL